MRAVGPVLDGTVVVSAAAALALAPRAWRRREVRPGRGGRFGPEVALALVVALVYLNQVLFAVYVQRVRGGSTAFVARYLPPGWFDVPRGNPAIDWLAAHFPAPELLAPTVLRVQAFLELPLVLLAFAAVLRRLDHGLYVQAMRSPLTGLAAASYTVAFCAVEWDLRNPYTVDDIVLRTVSALVTPPLLVWLASRERARPPRGPVLFTLDLWAFGTLMLTLYDTALLYNLARLGDHLAGALAALAVLAATRFVPWSGGPAGPHTTALTGTLGRALVLFFVPALAVRYGVSFGTPELAAVAGLVVLLPAVRTVRLIPAALVGAAVGCAVAVVAPGSYYEATLLRSATGALLATTAVCALLDTSRARLDVLP
ncbi:hypothetical protein ACFVHI_19270 [Kitasatospora sp. NPDC127121]|uniref:hypothetical protein n=1 Tax=Kitasatospora sp. NPDC127121 TaxID=3345371 RepID=UPI00362E9062